jgi:hypothetical protein
MMLVLKPFDKSFWLSSSKHVIDQTSKFSWVFTLCSPRFLAIRNTS